MIFHLCKLLLKHKHTNKNILFFTSSSYLLFSPTYFLFSWANLLWFLCILYVFLCVSSVNLYSIYFLTNIKYTLVTKRKTTRGETFNRTLKIYLGSYSIKNINRQMSSAIQVFWKYTLLSRQNHCVCVCGGGFWIKAFKYRWIKFSRWLISSLYSCLIFSSTKNYTVHNECLIYE